jgi:hypothetical protein
LNKSKIALISDTAQQKLTDLLSKVMKRSGLLRNDRFLAKGQFQAKGYLGSGGLARFRDTLWAATLGTRQLNRLKAEALAELAENNREKVISELGKSQ